MAEAANSCRQVFVEELFKEVEVLRDGVPTRTTRYRLFVDQMITAGIKGGTGTPARKLLLEFMREQEGREIRDGADRAAAGESIEAFSWDAAKEALYAELKAADRISRKE